MMMVVLFGNFNIGKIMLFNELMDKYVYVGNWIGVIVEKKMGWIWYFEVEMVDLFGVYLFNLIIKDEVVVINYLLYNYFDLILNVINVSQFKCNLLLLIEVLEFGVLVIIVFNMIDDFKWMGYYYDFDMLVE